MNEIRIKITVAGMQYYVPIKEREAIAKKIQAGKENHLVRLQRDPANEWDTNALKVIWNDIHIGHVSKEVAAVLSKAIDEKKIIFKEARLNEINPTVGTGYGMVIFTKTAEPLFGNETPAKKPSKTAKKKSAPTKKKVLTTKKKSGKVIKKRPKQSK